ncbi:MAG: mannose-phosphate guanylyltransferase [Thermomicrobiales bacterium]|nr:mannose-phosphate guanylyltransferase [Thermomicrobiales bacterium]
MTRSSHAETPQSRSEAANFWAVIPAGGSGTRLWPLSRAARPKFLLPLVGSRSLVQQTVDRLALLSSPERTLVVCGPAHAPAIARQLPQLPGSNIVIEPAPKGSGPAIGLASAIVAKHDPDAIMGSFAADHHVLDETAFVQAVTVAIEAARSGWLVTIGLTPTRPETGYGYIERTDEEIFVSSAGTAYRSARFVEKPKLETATEYIASGKFLWNASMFIWRAGTFVAEMARLQPGLHAGIARIIDAWGTTEHERVMSEVWPTLPESTIDQGIMERTERVAVVPSEMGWSDIGDWHGLGELMEHDVTGNSIRADLIAIAATRCAVWSETERVVAVVGLEDVVVVDTPDALLVTHRAKAQDVRRVVESLKAQGRVARI